MKIAFIGQKGIPASYGGVERWTEEVATRLAAKGHDVTVYCRYHYTKTKNGRYNGIKLINIPSIPTKHLDTITHTLFATIHALTKAFDVIFYQALGPSSLIFIPKIFMIPVVTIIHRLDWKSPKWNIFAKLYLKFGEWITIKFADKVIVVSKEVKKYLKKIHNKKTTYIPNGITLFFPEKDYLPKWGLQKDKYILAVGRLVPEKRLDLLIKAFKSINSDYKLVIAGGSSFSEDYVNCLRELSSEKFVLFTNYVFTNQLAALYQNAYLFVNPSIVEGMPLVVLEAAGYGCCILLSDIEEHKDILGDNVFYFKKDELDNLKEKLQFLIKNPILVNEKKHKVKEFALTHYDWDKITKEIEECIGKLQIVV